MPLLHHEDKVCPLDLVGTQGEIGIGRQTGRIRFEIEQAAKHMLCGGASQPVPAADKEHSSHRFGVKFARPSMMADQIESLFGQRLDKVPGDGVKLLVRGLEWMLARQVARMQA